MPDIDSLLGQIQRLELEIYPGPWVANDLGIGYEITTQQQMPINSGIKDTFPRSDAEFIALARTALPQLAKALRAVMEIHKPFHADHYYNGMDGESLHRFVLRCDGCEESGGIEDYPCPTVRAITDAIGADDD